MFHIYISLGFFAGFKWQIWVQIVQVVYRLIIVDETDLLRKPESDRNALAVNFET